MGRRLFVIGILCCVGLACGKPLESYEKKAAEPAAAVPETPAEEATAKPAAATDDPKPEPAQPSVEVLEEPAPVAVAANEHQGFLSMDEISDHEALREVINSMAVSGGEKRKAKALKALKSQGSVAALLRAMRAESPNIRIQAARILRRMGVRSKAFTQALIAAIRSDPDQDVRGMVAEVLVFYRNRDTVPALIEVLMHDGGDGARINAARALAAIKDSRAVTALIAGLEDEDTWVRLRAAGALKRMGAKRAVSALVERLNDSNKRVQERAHQALRSLTGKALGLDYDAWRRIYPKRSK